MVITEIKRLKKHLCEVCTDSDISVQLDIDYVYENAIKAGEETSEEALKGHFAASEYKRAVSRSVWYIERGSLSEKRLLEKLKNAGFCASVAQRAADRMKQLGLIDDAAFASRLAENMLAACISRRQARQKLLDKGIPADIAAAALEELECDAADQLRALVKKKYLSKLSTAEGEQKVFAALARKGFGYADIKSVLKEFTDKEFYED